ncbi:ADP-ribosylation factor-like protein 13B isoform X2 [Scleropages formosus]|nr:ADP-ribosylation factor-like protein 13B isoform X2 [Scleropages formosus]
MMPTCGEWFKWWRGPARKVTLVMVGLDNAGKTTTVKGIQGEITKKVLPTVGFSKVDVKQDKFEVTIFDLGGGERIRGIWKKYYPESHGVVFVVDSSDIRRIQETKATIAEVLRHPWVSGKPVLVLANKQDHEGALAVGEIIEHLSLEKLVNRNQCPCQVEPCSAVASCGKKADGPIENGLNWLLRSIGEDYEAIRERVRRDTERQRAHEERELCKDGRTGTGEEALREGGPPQEEDMDDGLWAGPFGPVRSVVTENEGKLMRQHNGQEGGARRQGTPGEGDGESVFSTYGETLLQQCQRERVEHMGSPESPESASRVRKKKKVFCLKRNNRVDPLRPDVGGADSPNLHPVSWAVPAFDRLPEHGFMRMYRTF